MDGDSFTLDGGRAVSGVGLRRGNEPFKTRGQRLVRTTRSGTATQCRGSRTLLAGAASGEDGKRRRMAGADCNGCDRSATEAAVC